MIELKHCPFCGALPTTYEKRSRRIVEYSIACPNINCPCMPTTGDFDTEEKATEAWNKRDDYVGRAFDKAADLFFEKNPNKKTIALFEEFLKDFKEAIEKEQDNG